VPGIADDARAAVDALRSGRIADAHAALARAATQFDARTDDEVAEAPIDALLVGNAQLAHERFPGAVRTLHRGLRAVKDTPHEHLAGALAMTRAVSLTPMLRLEEAHADLETAEAAWREAGAREHLLVVLVQQAVVADLRADGDVSRAAMAEGLELMADLPDSPVKRARLCRLAALGADDDPVRSIEEIQRAGGAELGVLDPTSAVQLMGVLIRACLATRRRGEAEQWAARMSRRAATCGLPVGRVRARTARATLLLAAGDGGGAADLAVLAAETAQRLRATEEELRARLYAARGLQVIGQDRECEEQLREVVEAAGDRGAHRIRAEAIDGLRALGVTLYDAPADPAARFERLSARERHVMELVLAGRSNEEVAATAAVPEHEVERELSTVLNKLGARTRGELAAFAARLDADGERAADAPSKSPSGAGRL
jgi:DNA-binding CsgD family transcriptional regulator